MGGSSSTGPAAATGVMSALPPGFDVWSPDVPPAYAGLATASYNPLVSGTEWRCFQSIEVHWDLQHFWQPYAACVHEFLSTGTS